MDTAQLQSIIADMPLSDEAKKEVLDRQAAGDSPENIFRLIDAKLEEIRKGIQEEDSEAAAEYARLQEGYEKEVRAAANDLEKELDAIESDAKKFDAEISQDIDQARMEELKEQQQAIPGR